MIEETIKREPSRLTQDDPFIFTANDGVTLFMHHWKTGSSVRRQLLVVHGIGEHGGRYAHLPKHLEKQFSDIYALDLRGHGRSGGVRGYAPAFDSYLDDVKSAIFEIQKYEKNAGKKVDHKDLYILGHSMGGLITVRYLQREKKSGLKGAILSAPFLGMIIAVPKWKEYLGHALRYTFSKLQLSNEINPSLISHDPLIVEAYVKDRLIHQKCTPRLFFELMETLDLAHKDAEEGFHGVPSMFLVAGEDRIVDSAATLNFFAKLKDRNKSMKEYDGFFHEVLNEVKKDQVFQDISTWIESEQL